MARYVLSYRGGGAKPTRDVDKFRATPGVVVVDEPLPHAILVEGPAEVVEAASKNMEGWVLAPEKTYRAPGRHPLLDRFRQTGGP